MRYVKIIFLYLPKCLIILRWQKNVYKMNITRAEVNVCVEEGVDVFVFFTAFTNRNLFDDDVYIKYFLCVNELSQL